MSLDTLMPFAGLGGAGLFMAGLLYQLYTLVIKPKMHSLHREKENIAGHIAYEMAANVLDRAFGYSHHKDYDSDQPLQLVRFLDPLGQRVELAGDVSGNDHPDSFLWVWDWPQFDLRPVPISSIYLELDLCCLPYDCSVDWLVAHKDDIEIHANAVLMHYGVQRVKLQHTWLRDRKQQRVIFRVIFREREKSPAIPQQVSYEEMTTAWAMQEAGWHKYNRLERLEREQLAARILDYGVQHFNGTFTLKKLQAAFAGEISHRQIEALGQRLETMGVLEQVGGPKPRKINLEQARAFVIPDKESG